MAAAWTCVDLVVEAQRCRLMTIVVGGLELQGGLVDDKLGALASSLPRSGKAAAKAPSYLYLVLVDHGSASAPDSLLPTVLFLNATA